MAPLKLTYFDTPGLAEPIRLALEMSNIEWEDKRLTRDEFNSIKPNLPNGQVPILEGGGFVLSQSSAILRYVGKLGELYPTDALEAAKCDAISACGADLVTHARPMMMEQDEAKKAALREKIITTFMPTWLGNLSKHLADKRYFCVDKLTIADLVIVTCLTMTQKFSDTDVLENFPTLRALVTRVMEEPKIAAFTAKHAK